MNSASFSSTSLGSAIEEGEEEEEDEETARRGRSKPLLLSILLLCLDHLLCLAPRALGGAARRASGEAMEDVEVCVQQLKGRGIKRGTGPRGGGHGTDRSCSCLFEERARANMIIIMVKLDLEQNSRKKKLQEKLSLSLSPLEKTPASFSRHPRSLVISHATARRVAATTRVGGCGEERISGFGFVVGADDITIDHRCFPSTSLSCSPSSPSPPFSCSL